MTTRQRQACRPGRRTSSAGPARRIDQHDFLAAASRWRAEQRGELAEHVRVEVVVTLDRGLVGGVPERHQRALALGRGEHEHTAVARLIPEPGEYLALEVFERSG